jgi:Serine/Threonine/Tyrosine Kinase found in polyvalent proteins
MFHHEEGRVIKVTRNAPCFGLRGDLQDYLRNIQWSNLLFDDDIRLEGVLELGGFAVLVTSQPFIVGRNPTDEEVAEWFVAQGFVRSGHLKWRHPVSGCEIADAHSGNFVVTEELVMMPIDLQILHPGNDVLGDAPPAGSDVCSVALPKSRRDDGPAVSS